MKYRCLIADDELPARELLREYIGRMPFLHLVSECRNGAEVLDYIHENPVDILFLDIQMPQLRGTEVARVVNSRKSSVVFTTAYDKFAVEAFDLDAADYLLKPFSFERFTAGVSRAVNALQAGQPAGGKADNFILVKSEYKLIKIPVSEIVYIEGLRDYIQIHTSSAIGSLLTLENMKKMEELLPGGEFIRIHKSYIVQFDRIISIQGNQVEINKKLLPIGRVYRQSLMDRLGI